MFRTIMCVALFLCVSPAFAQYYQPSAMPQTNVQVNDFNGGMPQVNVQQGVEYQPRVQAPYYTPQVQQPSQTQWRPARQPDFYHYHQHEVVGQRPQQYYVPQQQYQQQYCVPQTYYTYPSYQQYYCYPQYRTNWFGW